MLVHAGQLVKIGWAFTHQMAEPDLRRGRKGREVGRGRGEGEWVGDFVRGLWICPLEGAGEGEVRTLCRPSC